MREAAVLWMAVWLAGCMMMYMPLMIIKMLSWHDGMLMRGACIMNDGNVTEV